MIIQSKVAKMIFYLSQNGSGEVSTTRYIFSGDELTQIKVIEQIDDKEALLEIYDNFKSDETLGQVCDSIEIYENSIVMDLKDAYVNSFEGRNKVDIYQELEEKINEL